MMLPTILFIFTALSASSTNAAAVINEQEIFYCPFDISASLASDSSSLDITYTSGNTQKNSVAFHNGNACYVRVRLTLGETKRTSLVISEIEYKGNQNAGIETSVAFDTAYAPIRYTPITLSGTGAVTARNTTKNNLSLCSAGQWAVNVQTFFKDASKLTDFKLTQHVKLNNRAQICDGQAWPNCFKLDIDGKPEPGYPC